MGGFFAFQAKQSHVREEHNYAKALKFFHHAKGMTSIGEAGTSTRVTKFSRTHSPSSSLGISSNGWLATAGTWYHQDCDDPECTTDLLRRLELHGLSELDKVDGGYVMAWYDARSDILTVVPDHLGRVHAYYAESEAGVYVSTSATALAGSVSCEPDPLAVYELLSVGAMYEDRSPFLKVRRMQDARRYVFREGRHEGTHLQQHLMVPRPGRELGTGTLEDVIESYHGAIRKCIQPYERLVVDLTGGYDSRLVVGLLLQVLQPFDVTVTGVPSHPDVGCATKLAKSLGLKLVREDPKNAFNDLSSFPEVLRAAARVDGQYDAIEYVSIGRIQESHGRQYSAGVNAAGGEMWRSFWWNDTHLESSGSDPVSWVLPRFAGLAVDPQILDASLSKNPYEHFTGILHRSLEDRKPYPAFDQLDHFYIGVRMQCWQGAITSATNEIWPNVSLHLFRLPLEKIFNVEPRKRLACGLAHEMFRRMGKIYANCPLDRGFPPQEMGIANVWRFVWGARSLPSHYYSIWKERQKRKKGINARAAEIVKNLFSSGADEFFQSDNLYLLPLLNRQKLNSFLTAGRETGMVNIQILGRLVSLELAFRNAQKNWS